MSGDAELDEIEAIFFEECAEGLAIAEQGLAALNAGEGAGDTIDKVFRAVHSIKGGSGAFGHAALLAFSHGMENTLDGVRAGGIAASPAVVRTLLMAVDVLADHVEAARGQRPVPDDAALLAALDALVASGGVEAVVDVPAPEADAFGFSPLAVALESFELDTVAASPAAQSCVDAPGWVVRFVPSRAALANGAEPLLAIREVERLGGRVTMADCQTLPPLADLDPEGAYLAWTLWVPGDVAEAMIAECFDFVAPDSVIEIVREQIIVPGTERPALADAAGIVAEVAPGTAPAFAMPREAVAATPAVAPDQPAQSIRVDLARLDMLLNLVGELVIRGSILSDRLAPADQERVELPELARLTREIQHNVMSLRAQPIRHAFSRVPRLLRDLGASTGKTIQLEISGEGTEIDKGVIEKIGDPLTHMIRNAVDHGIESPETRLARGKPAEGTIRLSAEQRGARILVRVSDDGGGIDRVQVRAKAIERRLIAPDAQLSDTEIDQLICAPGFSTAATVSNISGRGVGMDVVRSNVEALGGRVDIASVPGEGTSITMVLPLTLAILDGMIVRLAGQRFVLPLANVIETVQPEPGQVRPTTPSSEVIELRGSYLPVKRLTELFGIAANDRRLPHDCLVVIVETDKAGHVGLMVDTIDDRREVVIKSLDRNLHPIRGLGGATILGDGSIALILDIEALVGLTPTGSKAPMAGVAA